MGRTGIQNVASGSPVRMFWKADSTFDASSAEVSMNDSPFSAVRGRFRRSGWSGATMRLTSKGFRLLGWHSTQVLQIALIPDEHDNDVGVGVVTKFLQPPCYVDIGRMLCDVINEQSTDGASVVSAA